jgi:hypothetical protein
MHHSHPARCQSHRNMQLYGRRSRSRSLTLTTSTRIGLSPITLKLVERIVAARFTKHVNDHKLFPAPQPAYHRFHSTETAIASVHNDLIRATDADHVTALVLYLILTALSTRLTPTFCYRSWSRDSVSKASRYNSFSPTSKTERRPSI